jgi:bifunctional DNA-binding transcriptional regulator/antitoxin component of YhaV-PrlF toxin-antitoxin module
MPQKHTVKLTRVSKYSYTITIPKEIIAKYKWKEKQKITVEDKGRGKVEIRDFRSKK